MKKKNIIISVLSAVSAALLVTVIVLICVLYTNDKESYYDDKCEAYFVQNQNASKGQIVFIGDSITDLYILDDHYSKLDLATYNRGIAGDTTSGVLKRLQVSLFDIKPSKVVLMIGTNDVNGNSPNKEILQRYKEIIDSIYDNLPEVELYCLSVIPQNEDLESYTTIKVEKTTGAIIELNKGIKALADKYGATYIDLFSLLADENNRLIKEYSDDGIHLNEKGLSVWTELMMPYFLKSEN